MATKKTLPAIFTFTEEDMQTIANERIGRELTADELRVAANCFHNGLQWAEIAEIAIDCAVEDMVSTHVPTY